MKVWIKEIPEVFEASFIQNWIKKDISVHSFLSNKDIDITDVLIISNKDENKELPLCTIVVFEEVTEKIMQSVLKEYYTNYDFYYMQSTLLEAKQKKIETVITGSSYGLFGINTQMLQNGINMSLASQDLYYSIKGIYEIWKTNKSIKKIVFCMSYYSLFSDLSKTQSSELERVSKVYWPLFQDLHNCVILPASQNALPRSDIFDIEKILQIYVSVQYQADYWNETRKRVDSASKHWTDKTKNWLDLSEDEKIFSGGDRAKLHNKNIKHEATLMENTKLLQDFITFCNENKIGFFVVVPPASKYYRAFSEPKFKEIFYDILNRTKGEIHLLDLYEEVFFEDKDFNDMDHLSDSGADKMTAIILDLIK